jgi:hypothetical protein
MKKENIKVASQKLDELETLKKIINDKAYHGFSSWDINDHEDVLHFSWCKNYSNMDYDIRPLNPELNSRIMEILKDRVKELEEQIKQL